MVTCRKAVIAPSCFDYLDKFSKLGGAFILGSITGKICITNGFKNRYVTGRTIDNFLCQGWWVGSKRKEPSTFCKHCGKSINKHDGKSGFCRTCFVKLGFQKKLNNDPEICRKRIINATGKKRSAEFKKKQSEDMKRYYQLHPERRKAQGEVFSKAWKEGKHTKKISMNPSKAEIMMYNAFVKLFGEDCVSHQCYTSKECKHFFPDVVLFGIEIIEYYGDYWHANPHVYSPDDKIADGVSAKEQWELDRIRLETLHQSSEGTIYEDYNWPISNIRVIWEHDTAHLKTQEDWDAYIAYHFAGEDELISC